MNRPLMLEIAGFLLMQAEGFVPVPPHVQQEAAELLEKVGKMIEANK